MRPWPLWICSHQRDASCAAATDSTRSRAANETAETRLCESLSLFGLRSRVHRVTWPNVTQLPFLAPSGFVAAADLSQAHPSPFAWIILRDREVLMPASDPRRLPDCAPALEYPTVQHLGSFDGKPIMAAAVKASEPAPSGYEWVNLRSLYGVLEDGWYSLCGRAAQLLDWDRSHAFCGRCGTRTVLDGKEHSRKCTGCGTSAFPRLDPAVIVAVMRPPNQILLARASRLPPGVHSVLAGFVEPGESLEQCVAREVFEETAIRVGRVQYVCSQPWPFPRTLMVAFVAEYAAGSIQVDTQELLSAEWFGIDALPPLPSHLTIARHLIEHARGLYGR